MNEGDLARSLFAIFVVFGLLLLFVWLAKRGTFGGFGSMTRQGRALLKVEGAVALGERRSLMVVSVEGRRLLLGLTPVQVSLVAELSPAANKEPFEDTLARSMSAPSHS
jgi:flagellar protein FliO/FliZ